MWGTHYTSLISATLNSEKKSCEKVTFDQNAI